MSGWIGIDLDGTLAHFDEWRGEAHIGEPIPRMVKRVRRMLDAGVDVRIFTARASDASDVGLRAIREWCAMHLGRVLPITITSAGKPTLFMGVDESRFII